MNLFKILISGGWIMIPIALSSVFVIALGISRFLTLNREHRMLTKFVSRWKALSGDTDPNNYLSACRLGSSFTANIAIIFTDKNPSRSEATESIEGVGRQELYRLETGLGTIATLAAATPLLGFLGTVTGMIKAFMQIQSLGGNVNANVLAGGIWEALVTTAAGLAVGIMALIIHNYLAGFVKSSSRLIEQIAEITLRIMGQDHEA